jgi:hypothetical protein
MQVELDKILNPPTRKHPSWSELEYGQVEKV